MSVIVFVCVLAGAFFGMFLRNTLPEHHLSDATKDVVKLGTGLIGTITGLVLGLLIASANSTFETESSQVQQMTANIVVLDQILAQYGAGSGFGPQSNASRSRLYGGSDLARKLFVFWKSAPFEAGAAGLALFDEILKLSPQNERQRSVQARAIGTLQEIAKTRLLLFAEAGSAIPMPFLVVLIFWLAIIFASFSLFADNNATTVVALCIFALSASAAIFLILELGEPFTGLMRISSEPLRNALAPLSP